jgi:hypothetical protein
MLTKKYPRTPHFLFSPGASSDDKIVMDVSCLIERPIICTEKLDGGCGSLESIGIFARTHAHAPTHPSFDWLKAFHKGVAHLIPEHIQVFGEMCYAQHTIAYTALPSYFLVFAVRNLETNVWASWDEVKMWADKIGAPTVPVLYRGAVESERALERLVIDLANQSSACGGKREGVVVRLAEWFQDEEFPKSVMKYVNKGFTDSISDEHWMHKTITKNGLAK